MSTARTHAYPDALLFMALLNQIDSAQEIIAIVMFLFRINYASDTRSIMIFEALKRAKARGVRVCVLLNYSRFETDVAEQNYATGEALHAAGCDVRFGPLNQTVHTKLIIIDRAHVFLGSHNMTRGALSFNREATLYTRLRAIATVMWDYFIDVWENGRPFADVPPPAQALAPVKVEIGNVTQEGPMLKAAFSVNHTEGVDAFAAVVATNGNLVGSVMGETVATTAREASVLPTQEPGATVYVAVRAYAEGQVIATSDKVRLIYDPTATGGGGEGDGGGGEEPPPPEPLTAPHLESVVAGLNGTEITAAWTFAGCPTFHRFEIQKRNVDLTWGVVGVVMDANARQWVGPGPGAGFTEATYRVVVFNLAEESAASNEITITGETPVLEAPVLVSVTQIGPMGINVEYSHVTPAEFARYEVQQRTNGSWQTLGTITTPETRSWSGGPVAYMDTTHPVRVVVFVQSGDSAGSNEMAIAPM